jgi:hypothetical protein
MSCIHRRLVRILAVCACTFLGLAASAPAAFAVRVEDSGGSPPSLPIEKDPTYTLTHSVATVGMPWWQIAMIIAVATLLVAALLAVIVHRVRATHRNRVVPAT